MVDHASSDHALRALAVHGLSGCTLDVPRGPFDDGEWTHLMQRVRWHGLEGHLADVIRQGRMDLLERQRLEAVAAHLDGVTRVLRIERQLAGTVSLLDSGGLAFSVVGGAALARVGYAKRSLRTFEDIELLLSEERVADAVALLNGAGYRCGTLDPGIGRLSRTIQLRTPDGLPLELHAGWPTGPTMAAMPVWTLAPSHSFELWNNTVPTVDPAFLLVDACVSILSGARSLVLVRDVAELVGQAGDSVGSTIAWMERCGAAAAAAAGIVRAWDVLELVDEPPLVAWARDRGLSTEPRLRPAPDRPTRVVAGGDVALPAGMHPAAAN